MERLELNPATHPLRYWPDVALATATPEVTRFDGDLRALSEFMWKMMTHHRGVGLAANQIGFNVRMAVVDTNPAKDAPPRFVMVNPRLVSSSDPKPFEEGCLSVPTVKATTARDNQVTVEYQDLVGATVTATYTGVTAYAVQHEMDHLNGKIFFERCTSTLVRNMIRQKMKKLHRRGQLRP
jgi:peptide deformylase